MGPRARGRLSKKSRKGALGPPRAADSHHTFASAHSPSDLPTLLQMTTLYSTEGAPGKSWRLNRGVGGMQLFVPAKGRGSEQIRLPADPATRIAKVSKAIDVAVDLLPQALLDALRSSGAILRSNCVPCVELSSSCPAKCSHSELWWLVRSCPSRFIQQQRR